MAQLPVRGRVPRPQPTAATQIRSWTGSSADLKHQPADPTVLHINRGFMEYMKEARGANKVQEA